MIAQVFTGTQYGQMPYDDDYEVEECVQPMDSFHGEPVPDDDELFEVLRLSAMFRSFIFVIYLKFRSFAVLRWPPESNRNVRRRLSLRNQFLFLRKSLRLISVSDVSLIIIFRRL